MKKFLIFLIILVAVGWFIEENVEGGIAGLLGLDQTVTIYVNQPPQPVVVEVVEVAPTQPPLIIVVTAPPEPVMTLAPVMTPTVMTAPVGQAYGPQPPPNYSITLTAFCNANPLDAFCR